MKPPLPAPPTLTALIETVAASHRDNTALIYEKRSLSYAELLDASRRVAQGLADLGVGPGDRVALWLPAVPAWLIIYLALARLGAVTVAVNTRFRSTEAAYILRRSRATVLVMWPGFKHINFASILADIEPAALEALTTVILYDKTDAESPVAPVLGRHTVSYRQLAASSPYDGDQATPESGCNVVTTSGTTKAPKLVLHKQEAIAGHVWRIAYEFDYTRPGTKILHGIPFCGVFGLNHGLSALAAGATLIIQSTFNPTEAAQLIDHHHIHHINGPDEMFFRLLDATDAPRPFPSLRWCGAASFSSPPQEMIARSEARGLRLVGIYGMSEIQALLSYQPPDGAPEERMFGGGAAVWEDAEIRVRDRDSGELLPPGEDGELEVLSGSRMVGYLDNEEATREAFTEDGFFRTGDLGHLCGDGRFVFLSRMGDALRLGGFLVSPTEIEAYINLHSAISGTQLIGVQRPRGIWLCAFVTLKTSTPFDATTLGDYCRHGMAHYKVPDHFEVLDAFPITLSANGTKIQKTKLRIAAEALLDAQPQ